MHYMKPNKPLKTKMLIFFNGGVNRTMDILWTSSLCKADYHKGLSNIKRMDWMSTIKDCHVLSFPTLTKFFFREVADFCPKSLSLTLDFVLVMLWVDLLNSTPISLL